VEHTAVRAVAAGLVAEADIIHPRVVESVSVVVVIVASGDFLSAGVWSASPIGGILPGAGGSH
jgi:hypothetical protein